MTETIIERVARALFVKTKEEASSRGIQSSWENCPIKGHYIDLARAAVAAMREPTEAMERAAFSNMDKNGYAAGNPTSDYSAMIDAALKE